MRPRKLAGALLALGLVVATGCGNDDIESSKFESELIKSTPGLSKAEASCITDKVYDTFDQDEINKLYSAENVKDLSKSVTGRFDALTAECASGA